MTEWLARIPSRRRLSMLFWLINAVAILALLSFALR